MVKIAPGRSVRLPATMRAAHRLDEAAADRQAQARCRRAGGRRRRRGRTCRTHAPDRPAECPGPSSSTCRRPCPPSRHALMVISEPAGAYLPALSSRLNSTCSNSTSSRSSIGRSGSSTHLRPVLRQDLAGAPQRAADRIRQIDRAGAQPQRPGLQPRHVQQVADEAIEPLRLVLDVADQIAPRRCIERLAEAGRGAQDRRQRRAQIVRDRGQQRRAQPVGLGHQARAIHILDQVHALDRQRRLVGQRIEQPVLIGREDRRLARRCRCRPRRPRRGRCSSA